MAARYLPTARRAERVMLGVGLIVVSFVSRCGWQRRRAAPMVHEVLWRHDPWAPWGGAPPW